MFKIYIIYIPACTGILAPWNPWLRVLNLSSRWTQPLAPVLGLQVLQLPPFSCQISPNCPHVTSQHPTFTPSPVPSAFVQVGVYMPPMGTQPAMARSEPMAPSEPITEPMAVPGGTARSLSQPGALPPVTYTAPPVTQVAPPVVTQVAPPVVTQVAPPVVTQVTQAAPRQMSGPVTWSKFCLIMYHLYLFVRLCPGWMWNLSIQRWCEHLRSQRWSQHHLWRKCHPWDHPRGSWSITPSFVTGWQDFPLAIGWMMNPQTLQFTTHIY